MLSTKASFKVNLTNKKPKSLRPKTISNIRINDKRIKNNKLNYSTTEFIIGSNPLYGFNPNNEIIQIIEKEINKQHYQKYNIINNIYNVNNFDALIMNPIVYLSDSFMNYKIEKDPFEICSNKKINGFIAFRIYYSQYGKGLKQNILSNILSKIWHTNENEQILWDRLTQEFCRKK